MVIIVWESRQRKNRMFFLAFLHWNHNCIRRSKTITVIYDSFSADEVTERLMDPYDVFFSDGNLYLAAYCHKRQSVCNFRIDRFKEIKSINGTFVRDSGFNLNEFLGPSWRVWHGAKKATVKFIVYPPASRFFRESAYHNSQRTEELEDGKLLCALTVYITPEIKSWLLSWGKQVKLLEPFELVEEIKDELRESLEIYE
jgi:predicted DNA-binding transcriptional regulator YafY